jgi:hypothetical protein
VALSSLPTLTNNPLSSPGCRTTNLHEKYDYPRWGDSPLTHVLPADFRPEARAPQGATGKLIMSFALTEPNSGSDSVASKLCCCQLCR